MGVFVEWKGVEGGEGGGELIFCEEVICEVGGRGEEFWGGIDEGYGVGVGWWEGEVVGCGEVYDVVVEDDDVVVGVGGGGGDDGYGEVEGLVVRVGWVFKVWEIGWS